MCVCVCVRVCVCVCVSLTRAGFCRDDEDKFLESRAWKGKDGSYSLAYAAEVGADASQ
jgi:hypothetical protein